jgi:phage-related minor tail protein
MVNLESLKFSVDTKELDTAIKKWNDLHDAMKGAGSGTPKPSNTPKPEDTEKTVKGIERVIRVQETKNQFVKEGYGLSQANLLAIQKENGATDSQINSLQRLVKARQQALQGQREMTKGSQTQIQALKQVEAEMQRVNDLLGQSGKAYSNVTRDSITGFQQMLRQTGLSLKQQGEYLDKFTAKAEAAQKAQQTKRVGAVIGPQVTDIVVGLGNGQSLFQVATQQGGQLVDTLSDLKIKSSDMGKTMILAAQQMGSAIKGVALGIAELLVVGTGKLIIGLGNMAREMLGVNKILMAMGFSAEALSGKLSKALSFTIGAGLLIFAAALAVVAKEMWNIAQAGSDLARANATMGASLGMTQAGFKTLADNMKDTKTSSSAVIGVFTEVAKAGGFASKELEMISRSAIEMEKYVGVAIKDTVESFKKMKKEPVEALYELQKQTGLVSQEVLNQVRVFEEQGKGAAAAALAVAELAKVNAEVVRKTKDNISAFDLFIIMMKEDYRGYVDFVATYSEKLVLSAARGYGALSRFIGQIGKANGALVTNLSDAGDYTGLNADVEKQVEVVKTLADSRRALMQADAAFADQNTAEYRANLAKRDAYQQDYYNRSLTTAKASVKAQKDLTKLEGELAEKKASALGLSPIALKAANEIILDKQRELREALKTEGDKYRTIAREQLDKTLSALKPTTNTVEEEFKQRAKSLEQSYALELKLEKEQLDKQKAIFDAGDQTQAQSISNRLDIVKSFYVSQSLLLNQQVAEQVTGNKTVTDAIIADSKARTDAISKQRGLPEADRTQMLQKEAEKLKKVLEDLATSSAESAGKFSNVRTALDAAFGTNTSQILAEFGKDLKRLKKELEDFYQAEENFNNSNEIARNLQNSLLWADPKQAAVINAVAKATEFYTKELSKAIAEQKKYQAEVDSLGFIASQEVIDNATKNLEEANKKVVIVTENFRLGKMKATVDAATDYELRERWSLLIRSLVR